MLTAVADHTDRVVGLELGADIYLTKPFDQRKLLARGAPPMLPTTTASITWSKTPAGLTGVDGLPHFSQ